MDWGPAEYEPGLSSSRTDEKEWKTFWPFWFYDASGDQCCRELWNADQNYLNSGESLSCRCPQIPRRISPGGKMNVPGKTSCSLVSCKEAKQMVWVFANTKACKTLAFAQKGDARRKVFFVILPFGTNCWLVHASLLLCTLRSLTPATMASPGCLITMQNLSPNPDLLNQNQKFNIPRWPIDTLKFEKSTDAETTVSLLTCGIITTKLG